MLDTVARVTSVELSVPATSTFKLVLAFACCVPLRPCEEVSTLNLFPSAVVTVEEKVASSFMAAANSLSVFKAPGAESTRLATSVST